MISFERFSETVRNSTILPIGILFIVAVVPYLNIFPNEFVFDDFDFFVQWEGIKSVKNIPAFFEGDLPTYHQHVYRPIRSVVQSIVYALSGNSPIGFHIFSLFVQVLGVFIAYLVARRLLKPLSAFIVGLIFAVLPVHTDSIAFMTASFDTFGAILGLASFYFYLLSREKEKLHLYILSFLFAILAFFSYEINLVLPILFFLYDFLIRNETVKEIARRYKTYLPYIVALAFYLFTRAHIVGSTFTGSLSEPLPFFDRMATMLKAFLFYVYLTIVGTPLSIAHDIAPESSFFSAKVFSSLLALFAIGIFFIYAARTGQRLLAFGIAWFFAALLPVSNVIPLATFVSEHYLYVASFGWAFLVALCFETASSKIRTKNGAITLLLAVTLLVGTYGYLSFDRNRDWKNSETIYGAAITLDPEYAGGYNGLAFQYRLRKEYEKAQQYAKKAVEINPNYFTSYALLGEIYMEQEKCEEAISYFTKALEINESYVSSFLNRGVCFFNLKRFKEAEEDFLKALEIYPDYTLAHENIGVVYALTGQFEKAIPHLKRVVAKQDSPKPEYLLGVSYINVGKIDEGKKRLEQVLRLVPGHEETLHILKNLP